MEVAILNCIICNNSQLKIIKEDLRDYEYAKVVLCSNCNHGQLEPLPLLDKVQEYYDRNMQAKSIYTNIDIEHIRKKSIFDVTRRLKLMQKFILNKERTKVLEIGTGYGFFVREAEKEGYQIEGIEISKSRREFANTICKNKIYSYNLLKEVPQDMIGKYNIVVMFQVLEHILDPKLFLNNVKKLLNNEGILIIEVPNLDDHLLRISKEYLNFFYQVAHISYYSPKSLKLLLHKCNYKNISIFGIQRYSIENSMNWIINKKPQIDSPAYQTVEGLKWIDDYYKQKLISELKSDTIVAIAYK